MTSQGKRIRAGVAALAASGFTGCICLHCASRNPEAAAARKAVLTAQRAVVA